MLRLLPALAVLISVATGCHQQTSPPETAGDTTPVNEPLIRANQRMAREEASSIDNYIQHHGLAMDRTGTGLRYMILQKGNGPPAQAGMKAKVNFTLSLLDGTICYSSDSTGSETFVIDQDQVESGLHEGVKLLHQGDRAKFILPSHLAHGLLGDDNKIPPRSPVIYDIQLLQLN